MVEVRFKPADVGTVADGSVTEVKLSSVLNTKINDKVDGTGTTGNKKVLKVGWDSTTNEVVIDHEA